MGLQNSGYMDVLPWTNSLTSLMPFQPTKRCNANSTQPQSAAKKMSPWCCSMVTYHGIESNSHGIFQETYRPIRIIKDNAWVEIERFSYKDYTTPAIYRTIPNLLMWLFSVPIRCSLWVAICRWLLGMEVSVWCLSVFTQDSSCKLWSSTQTTLETSKTWKELLLKITLSLFLLFFCCRFLGFSLQTASIKISSISHDKNGPPPVDQVAVEDRQRHPPWVFRYLKGPSRIDLGKIDATSTNSRGWFLKVMEKYVNVMCT